MHKKAKTIAAFVLIILAAFVVLNVGRFVPVLFGVFFNKNIELKKSENKNINILLLGIGGAAHDGPNLSDTVIFASIDTEKNTVHLVSIPRDLWIPELKAKVNSAYAIGQEKRAGGGLILAKATVSKIVGQEIDYGFRIDFGGFVKAIDTVGGLDISIDNTFDDNEYPNEQKTTDLCGHTLDEATKLIATEEATVVFPCRYEHIHFDAGPQHLTGDQALIFVRSRHAEGIEGSDFARSKRQQKVIEAFKDKLFSAQTLLNPAQIIRLSTILGSSVDTDIHQDEYDDFIRLFQKTQHGKIQSSVLDTGDQNTKRYGLLINPVISKEYGYQWVLIPRAGNGNFSEIQKYINCTLVSNSCTITSSYEPGK